MDKDLIRCPYCNYESDESNFPDLFYQDLNNSPEVNKQYRLLEDMWANGFNIVTCGSCGQVFIQKL